MIRIIIFMYFCLNFIVAQEQNFQKLSDDFYRLYEKRKFAQAMPIAKRLYKQAKIQLGVNHPDTLHIMTDLGFLFLQSGEYKKAQILYNKKNLNTIKEIYGDEDVFTLGYMNNLASLYQNLGKYLEASVLSAKCLTWSQKVQGVEHPNTLISMNNLASIYKKLAKYEKAKSLYLECLQVSENSNISISFVITCMNNLAGLYDDLEELNKAEDLYQKCLELCQNKLEKGSRETFACMNGLAIVYKKKGLYELAESMYIETWKSLIDVYGENHIFTLSCLHNLAGIYKTIGKYDKSESFYLKCIKMRIEKLGKNHPATITSQNNLAELYQEQGKYGEAESLYLECSQKRVKTFGQSHPSAITSLANIANIYREQGKYQQAESTYFDCIKLTNERQGEHHSSIALYMNSLAILYEKQEKYEEAEIFYEKCIKKSKESLGDDHPNTISALSNLAVLYLKANQHRKAEQLSIKTLEWRKKIQGKKHPDTLNSLNTLATLYLRLKNYNNAEQMFLESFETRKVVLGQNHPDTLISMHNLMIVYCQQKKYVEAQEIGYQRMQSLSSYLSNVFSGLNKNVQQYFLFHENYASNVFLTLNLNLNNKNTPLYFAHFSLAQKALLLSIASQIHKSSQNMPLKTKSMLQELNQNRQILAHNILNSQINLKFQLLENELKKVKEKIDDLEREIGLDSKKFAEIPILNITDIQESIAKKQAVIDFLVFDKINLINGKKLERHLVVSIIRTDKIHVVDMGSFSTIEYTLNEYREAILHKTQDVKIISQKIYGLIWQPLLPYIKDANNFIISPDAELHMFPFASLCNEKGLYFVETTEIQTISSLRSLAEREKIKAPGNSIIFANPNYNQQIDNETATGMYFSELPGTKKESKSIANIFTNKNIKSVSYTEEQATKMNVLNIRNPRILHLATHGFCFPPKETSKVNMAQKDTRKTETIINLDPTNTESTLETRIFFDPLSYCGLAFSGANKSSSINSILLGTEIPSLPLHNTELVVLSACETGVGTTETITSEGEIYKAEEVFSLRRAFEEAGARAVLSTMWPAADKATQNFMTRFYELYTKKIQPQDALRVVQLEFLRSEEYSHPYFWANFVLVGANKHFPEHTNKIKTFENHSYISNIVIFVSMISIIIMIFCYIGIIEKKRRDIKNMRKIRIENRGK